MKHLLLRLPPWGWYVLSAAAVVQFVRVPIAVEPHAVFLVGSLLCAALVVIEHQWPQHARHAYASSLTASLVLSGIVFVCLGVLRDFYRVPFGAAEGGGVIGRTLPFSDADAYLVGVRSLLEFGQLSEWASRRPTAAILYAVVYAIAGEDMLRFQLGVALVFALLSALTVIHLMRSWGLAAASCFFTLMVVCYAGAAGRFLSEPAGLILGLAALPPLLAGHERRDFRLSALGIAMVALAVLTRAGALLT